MRRNSIILISLFIFILLTGFSCVGSSSNLGVYKSEDGGSAWQEKVRIDDKKTISKVEVLSIKIDPQDSNVLYIGTKDGGVYKSGDGGNSWQQTALKSGNIFSIDLNFEDSGIIYVAGYFGTLGKIYKSNNGGENFEEIYSETHENNPVLSLAIDSYDPRKIYAGTENGALLKSEDSGRSWILQAELDDDIIQIAISPHDTRHVLAGTASKGLFKTEDGGQNWRDISDPLKEFDRARSIRSIVFDPKNSGRVYLGSYFGLLVSDNEGGSWAAIDILTELKRSSVIKLALDNSDEPNIYLSVDSTIYKKSRRDEGWEVNKITSGIIKSIAVDLNNNQIIYVGIGTTEDDY